MRQFYLLLVSLFFAAISRSQNVNVAGAVSGNGSYATLGAAFTAINGGAQGGAAIVITIVGNTTEAASAVLNSGTWATVTINPSGGAARTVSGSVAGPLIDLNGADNVTIDGLNTGGNSLTISNTSTSGATNTSTIRFIADASNNTVTNSTISGSSTSATLGTIFFSTGTTTGNDGNTISNSTIGAAGANSPVNGIYSAGTATLENSGNTIQNCNIADFFSATIATAGILVSTNSTDWTITGNRLYQAATRTYTAANTHRAIQVATGNNHSVTNNIIGYANSGGTGVYTMAGTVATIFRGIDLAVGTTTASSVQGNTVTAISLGTSATTATGAGTLCGIVVSAGNVNIGTVTGNTIGASSGTNAITITSTGSGAAIVGINSSGTGTISIQNNTIGALSSSGTTATISGSVYGITISGVAASMNITGNTIGNSTADNMRGGTSGLTTGSSLAAGINASSSATTLVISNNTIQNFSSFGTGTSGYVRGIFTATTGSSASTISGNTIRFLTTNGALTGYTSGITCAAGIHLASGNNAVISANTIHTIANTNSTATTNIVVAGIALASATNTTATRNQIYNLSNASIGTTATAPPVVVGVLLRSGTTAVNITNNMISLGNGQTTNTAFIGIMGNHGSTPDPVDNIYHNSINIEGTVTSGALSTFCFLRGDLTATSRNQTVDIKDNIFTNTRTGGTGRHFAIANNFGATSSATGWAANASNYNVLNAAPATVGYWTADQTFAGWQAASASDLNSMSGVSINYVNAATGDLHIQSVPAPPIESAGIAIPSVTVDFDNQNRAAFSPTDIGADADNFFTFPIMSYTPLSNVCATGARTLTATITDPDGVPTAGIGLPVLYWRINAGAYTGVQATYIGSNQYQFTFGGSAVIGDVVSYYIVAQDNAGNVGSSPNVGAGGFTINPPAAATPPTSPNTYTLLTTMSGTYTVGVGGNFTTLTAAVNAYNTNCIGGAIIFNLIDATYPSETYPITINQNASASAVNTLTIKPAATATLSGSVASGAMIRVMNNYTTIDGSNNGSSSRDLTITNTNTTGPTVVLLASSGTTPITNSTLKNCIIINGANTASAVVVSDAAVGTAGYFNNITVQNNSIQRAYIGNYNIAVVAAGNGSGLLVTQNELNTSGANSIRLAGIYLQGIDGATVSNNTIGNMANTSDASNLTGIWLATATANTTVSGNTISGMSGTATAPRGIAISAAAAASNNNITGNTITGLTSSTTQVSSGIYLFSTTGGVTIQKNKIRDIKNTSGTSTASYGLNLASTATGNNVVVSNNMISDVASFGSATVNSNGNGIVISAGSGYSLYFNTVHLNTNQTFATGITSAINITSGVTAAGAIDLRNNIFSNVQTVGANQYAIYSGAANTVFSNIDYNDYYSAGANLGFIGSNRATLADIQTGFGGNTNSTAIMPVFMTPIDLHLNPGFNNTLNNTGTAIAGITTDIDGDTRTGPDVGADEFSPCSPAATASASSNSPVCEGSTLNLTGTSDGNTFLWTGPNGFSSTLLSPSIPNVTSAAGGTYYFQGFLNGCPSQYVSTNVTVNLAPVINSVTATPSTVCFNANSQLNVNATETLGYMVAAVTFAPIASGSGTITLASAGTATTALTAGSLDDGYWNALALPFPFVYYGTTYNAFNAQTNGIISFSAFTTTTGYSSSPQMPNTAVPNNILGVMGDMEWRFGGIISCYTSGVAPNRIFVIDYNGTTGGGFYNAGSAPTALVNFQIQLFENGNKIQFHTTSITSDASHNHTMGIENSGGTAAVVVPGRDNSLWSLANDGTEIAAGILTYLWSPATFLNNTTIQNPMASNVTATTTYTVQVTQSNGCSRTGNVTVTIDPANSYTVTGGGTYCPGGPGVPVGLSNSDVGIDYQLQLNGVNTGSPVAGTGSAISFGNQTAVGSYTVVAINPSSACTRDMTGSVVVSLYPDPDATPVPASQSICSGATITTIVITGSVPSTTFNWTRDNTGTVTGIPANGAGNISGSLTNTTNAPITVTFTIIPTANGCFGTPVTATVLVYPTPDAIATPSSQTICSGPITTIVLTSSVSGTTFNWTRDNTGTVTGIPANGSGNISGSLTNIAGTPITVTFTITPVADGCPGTPITATVLVNPLPTVNASVTQPTTCASSDGAIDVTVSGSPGPFTYFWSTVGGSGLVQGQEDQSGLTVGFYSVLVTDQTTGCQQTASWFLNGPGGCDVCPVVGSVSTNPTPTVCAGDNVVITASGLAAMGVTYGITFKYSVSALADPYTGGTVIGTVPNGSLGGGGTTATINTTFPAGSYYIYAILSPAPVDPSCRPAAVTNITVNPNPVVDPIANQTFCNNTVVPTGTINFTSPTTVFGGKILIAYADGTGAPTQLRNDLLATAGVTQVDLFDASGGTPTLAQMQQYDLVVPFSNSPYADPTALGDNLADYIDAGGTVVGLGFTFYTSPYGPTGRWLSGNYSPYTASTNLVFAPHTLGTYNAAHPLMNGVTILNSDYHNQVPVAAGGTEVAQWDNGNSLVAYKGRVVGVTAYIGAAATWSGHFAKLIVNAGNWLGSPGTITFNWTNSNTAIGLGANGTGTSLPTFTTTNPGTTPISGTINVTATYSYGGVNCTGPATTFTITVNPTPTVDPVANQTYCPGASVPSIVFSSPVAGTTFTWSRTVPTPDIGLAPTAGAGSVPAFTATNTSNGPITATFSVVPSYTNNGVTCTGPTLQFTITINPQPAVNAVANQEYCAGSVVPAIVFSGPVPGTTYSWSRTVPTPDIGLAPTAGTGNVPSFTATNTSTSPITSTFTVVASYTNDGVTCSSAPMTFTITINPTPSVNPVPNQTVCNGAPTAPVTFSGPIPGTVYNWTNNTPSIGLAASGTGNIASFNAINTGTTPVVATITVTPSINWGLVVVPFNFTGAVQPWVVPAGVTSINILAQGGQGRANAQGVNNGGLGGQASGTLAVTPGETLWIYVGGGGGTNITGGFNGGGNGGTTGTCTLAPGGGGGGASDVRQGANTLAGRRIVAGGGGGTAGNRVAACGRGAGGGGGGGYYGGGGGAGYPGAGGTVPTGGTQVAGGSGGITATTFGATNGAPGALGIGGAGGNEIFSNQVGNQAVIFGSGNGGGLTGGPGQQSGLNNFTGQSGAGGSSYIGGVTAGSTTAGQRAGNGFISISYSTGSAIICTGAPQSFTITVNPTPNAVATPSTQTICSGTAMTTIVLSGNVAGTTFNWTRNNTINVTGIPNAGSGNIGGIPINNTTIQQTVIFTITPIANGCPGTPITATLIINKAPTITCPANITVNATPGQCGAIVNYPPATATGSPAPVITYSQASGTFFPVGTTIVTATATNICGTASCTFTITVLDAQAPAITCPGNIVRNTDPGVCYATVVTPNPTFSDNCAVTRLTWTLSGATTGSSPATGINFVGTRQFNLNGTTGIGVTTVTYTAYDAAGNATSCSFTVTVNDALIPVIGTQPVTRFVCVGSNAVFSVIATAAGGPLTYQWQEWNGSAWVNIAGATTNTFTVNNVTFADNTRSFRVVLTGLCSVVISVPASLYINPLPTVSLTTNIPPFLLPGQTLNITAVVNPPGGTFAWYFNGVLSPTHTTAVWSGITVDGIGTYRLVYTDPNGCTSASADLVVTGQPGDRLWVYPNPNEGHFHVRFYNEPNEKATVRVFDTKGAKVYEKEVITGPAYTDIDVQLSSGNAAGVYIVEVRNGNNERIGAVRIIVRHR